MLKAENDALVMLPLVINQLPETVCQSVREALTASGVDNTASRLADTAERSYFTLQKADHCKNNWKEPRSILMTVIWKLPISMGNSCNQ